MGGRRSDSRASVIGELPLHAGHVLGCRFFHGTPCGQVGLALRQRPS
jgi:hypothetical protein